MPDSDAPAASGLTYEDRLSESEKRYRTLVEGSLQSVAIAQADPLRLVYVNPAFCRLLGYDVATLCSMAPEALSGLVHADDWEAFHAGFQRRLAGDDVPRETDVRLIRSDGQQRWVSVLSSLIEHEGRPATLTVMVDITQRKQAEAALRESEESYRQLFEAESDALFLIDNQTGRILRANPAAAQMYGYTLDDLLSLTNKDLSAEPEETNRVTRTTPVARERVISIPLRWHRKKDGSDFPVEITGRFFVHQGRAVHIAAIRDISERHRSEKEHERLNAQLAHAQRMESVGRLAGGVAHDYNNMLLAILANTDLALEMLSPSAPARAHLEEVMTSARRSADLTRKLLTFASRQVIAPRALDLNATLSGMLGMLGPLIGENISLVTDLGGDVWLVWMDPSQVDQILVNLCVNARDAIDGSGRVRITTRNVSLGEADPARPPGLAAGDYVSLTVGDDGRGMGPEVIERVFEPFFSTKGSELGTGLGLSTVFGIVKQNGGHIGVESEPGAGTTFRIHLPRSSHARSEAASPPRAAARGPGTDGRLVLLAEDDPQVRRAVVRMLGRCGHRVLEAGSGAQALVLAERQLDDIDLLMTDVIMPGMSGKELADALAARRPDLETLFMSGYNEAEIAHQGVLEPGVRFLQKPFSFDELQRMLGEIFPGQADHGR